MRTEARFYGIAISLLLLVSTTAYSMESFYRLKWIDQYSQVDSLLKYPQIVEELYQNNEYQLIWYDEQASQRLDYQLNIIKYSQLSLVFEERIRWLSHYHEANRLFEYDLLATDTLILYLNYAEEAPLSGRDWFLGSSIPVSLPEPSYALIDSLNQAVRLDQLDSFIAQASPPLSQTEEFRIAWNELQEQATAMDERFTITGLLRVGDLLNREKRALLINKLSKVGVDTSKVNSELERYDRNLMEAVKKFQSIHGLKQDGIIGPNTLAWLNTPPSERLRLLALNAERSRLWPTQREKIILVNVPSFQLEFWQAGEELFASKVVVGRKSRKTPLLNITLDSLVLNPSWNVPWKIMVKDILPKVKYDQDYLVTNNFKVINSWTDRTAIDLQEVDFSGSPKSFPYRLQQLPGNRNALGLYKFNTPNARAIYLHDTPSRHLFNEDMRAFSSGCIRVQHADTFASTLLESQGISSEKLAKAVDDTPLMTQSVRLRSRIPVHIIYQTVWLDQGVVNYRNDVYNYDGAKRGGLDQALIVRR